MPNPNPPWMTSLNGKIMAKPIIRIFNPTSLSVGWDWHGVGYGEIVIDAKPEHLEIYNNNLSKEEVRQILHAFVDYAVDLDNFVENRHD